MHPNGTLDDATAVDTLINRIGRLTPESKRQWGTMTPNEALCHLADTFETVLGERPCASAESFMSRSFFRWISLHTPLPWPKGLPTGDTLNPKKAGTKPGVFEQDRDRLVGLVRRVAAPEAHFGRHPFFGALTRAEWSRWGFRHVDHHLRQFGM